MTAATDDQNSLEVRRKRLKFQCWHRGFREIDLILGHFADRHLGDLSEGEISDLETLLCLPDQEIYEWITGKKPTPQGHETPILKRIQKLDFLDDTILRS